MVLASHYVIGEILERWDNLENVGKEFEKIAKRYPNDAELQGIYIEFRKSLETDKKGMDDINSKLTELQNIRKLEASGITRLPLKDRRQFE